MQSIQVHIPTLLNKIEEMSRENMESVKLVIGDAVIDQDMVYPAYLHFEAYRADGTVTDYESIDALSNEDPLDTE